MYLKDLTMFGFKSFADKTSLNFRPGITAIVGPNGCGKSNVADAVRWVLGEQSAKALRGGEMADVIFNGTDQRKPLSMAEVSLTLGDVDGDHLKAAGVEVAFNEVTVTRRVFRDGGSEYYLNKVPCRLKDIQQLFMGTGVGRTSYSIMAQGNITQILSSRPEDRRLVFEEAAGITKFKTQKKEALRKLEYTEQNLLRVTDLIREVKRQIGSLQRQAGKARRYKQFSVELQHLDTQLARHQYDVLQAEWAERTQRQIELRQALEAADQEVARHESSIDSMRRTASEFEARINAAQQRGLELKNQIERHEGRIQFNHQRVEELAQQHSQALAELARTEDRRIAAEQELTELRERVSSAETLLRDQRVQAATRRSVVQSLEEELSRLQETLRKAQADAFGAAQQVSRTRNELTGLDMQAQGHAVRMEKLGSERAHLEEERSRLEIHLQEFGAHVAADKIHVQTRRGSLEERQARLRDLGRGLTEATKQIDALLHQQAEVRSRSQVLAQLQESHEGFSSGAIAALQQSERTLGSLSDRLRVPAEHVSAVEAALGHHLQLVLAEKPEVATKILQELAEQRKGKASIASLQLACQRGSLAENAEVAQQGGIPEGCLPALSVIECDEAVAPLLRGLLGQTLITTDFVQATAAWTAAAGRFDLVTRQGEVLSRHGVFTGGSTNGHGRSPASILGRKNLLAELRQQLSGLENQIEEASRQRGSLASEQTALQASLQEEQVELRAQEVAIATRQGEYNVLQNSFQSLGRKIETVLYEIQTLTSQQEEARQRRQQLSAQVEQFEEKERAAQQRLSTLAAELEQHRARQDHAQASLSESKVTLASEEQRYASWMSQLRPLENRLQELAAAREHIERQEEEALQRRTQSELEIDESRRHMAAFARERESVNAQITEWISSRDALGTSLMTSEDALRTLRRQLSDLQEQKSATEVEVAQKDMAIQNLRERIQQKYQVSLDSIRSECITITIADEGPPKVETLTPEEMAQRGVATDWAAVGHQVSALQKRLDEMGPVNLVAIEEYEETEQRYQFLTTQCDDLTQAKEQLLDLVNRINVQTRDLFSDTFARIRENFRSVFAEIFGGGKADLYLVDDGDVLESGIEIVARPPGKQLQSISLLSGGEQTMTAVALLFAIYQVKPSPFCVLDELDAPLDESNINRFIRVLQRFLAHSQFVIITHNKRTIGMADVLYGITMEERGVSKVVSVKFHRSEIPLAEVPLRPLEPAPPGPSIESEEDERHLSQDTLEVVMAK